LDYKKLFDVGILHVSPESAANHVNKVWSDIDGWWHDQELQNVRLEFCKKYVCTSSSHDSINQWYNFFNKLL
jgi:putative transferase (TIGR04331 family)